MAFLLSTRLEVPGTPAARVLIPVWPAYTKWLSFASVPGGHPGYVSPG